MLRDTTLKLVAPILGQRLGEAMINQIEAGVASKDNEILWYVRGLGC